MNIYGFRGLKEKKNYFGKILLGFDKGMTVICPVLKNKLFYLHLRVLYFHNTYKISLFVRDMKTDPADSEKSI
jgi:hypothetical protein